MTRYLLATDLALKDARMAGFSGRIDFTGKAGITVTMEPTLKAYVQWAAGIYVLRPTPVGAGIVR